MTGGGREVTADVAALRAVSAWKAATGPGSAISWTLTVEDRGGARVVARIDPAQLYGHDRARDSGGRSVSMGWTVALQNYLVGEPRPALGLSVGSAVRFETEERAGGARVITALRRDAQPR